MRGATAALDRVEVCEITAALGHIVDVVAERFEKEQLDLFETDIGDLQELVEEILDAGPDKTDDELEGSTADAAE